MSSTITGLFQFFGVSTCTLISACHAKVVCMRSTCQNHCAYIYILMIPCPPFHKNHGNTQIMHKSSRIIKMIVATPNGRERNSITVTVSALQSKIPCFAHIRTQLLFLYSAILCFWADSVCSSCIRLWTSNCSFTHVSEYPPNWCIYNAVYSLYGWCHVKLLPSWCTFCVQNTTMHQLPVSSFIEATHVGCMCVYL